MKFEDLVRLMSENKLTSGAVNLYFENQGKGDHFDAEGCALIHHAVLAESVEPLKLLVEMGFDINLAKQHIKANNPLHLAVINGKIEHAILLLQQGADPNILNASKFSPLALLVIYGRNAISAEQNHTKTPEFCMEFAKILLDRKARPLSCYGTKNSPWELASQRNDVVHCQWQQLFIKHFLDNYQSYSRDYSDIACSVMVRSPFIASEQRARLNNIYNKVEAKNREFQGDAEVRPLFTRSNSNDLKITAMWNAKKQAQQRQPIAGKARTASFSELEMGTQNTSGRGPSFRRGRSESEL